MCLRDNQLGPEGNKNMIQECDYLESLISEYQEILEQCEQVIVEPGDENLKLYTDALCSLADWTERGANEILRLATDYGAFMLRNALAIAVVLGREDGELGF